MPIATTTLDCGLPLIVETIPGVASASLQWLIPAGAAHDPADRVGLSAILAELLLRGCGGLSSRQLADRLDSLGVLRSTEVGQQYLRLNATFVGGRVTEVLPTLVSMVREPGFDPAALEPSRRLALQSLAGLADNPAERAGVLLTQRHMATPLDRSGLGTEEGLTAVTQGDVLGAWERQCRPVGSILALAGDLAIGPVAGVLNGLLKDWNGAAPVLRLGAAPLRGTYHHDQDQSNQTHISLAYDAPPETSPDASVERLHNSVLSGGTSARLFTEVREKRGLCYSVSAIYASDRATGRVVGYVGTTPDKAQQSLEVMLAELQRAVGSGASIGADELERARIGFQARLVFSGESTAARAAALASDWHKLGRARTLEELARESEGVSLDRLNAYARGRVIGATTIVTVGPAALVPPGR